MEFSKNADVILTRVMKDVFSEFFKNSADIWSSGKIPIGEVDE